MLSVFISLGSLLYKYGPAYEKDLEPKVEWFCKRGTIKRCGSSAARRFIFD
jgi:hypothetical protein